MKFYCDMQVYHIFDSLMKLVIMCQPLGIYRLEIAAVEGSSPTFYVNHVWLKDKFHNYQAC